VKTLAIARNTLREAIRDRVFAIVAVFGLLLIVSSVIMSPMTVGAREKIVADMGLSAMSIFSLLVILFVGSGMVYKEIDKRTIMTILSKPISRSEYMVGKYLGLLSTLLIMMTCMALLFWGACGLTGTEFRASFIVSMILTAFEMVVVTAIVIFFSSFTTPVLTSLFTLAGFMVGHAVRDLEAFAAVAGGAGMMNIMRLLKFVLPNLDLFNVRNAAVHGLPIETGQVMWAGLYALVYASVLLLLSGYLFSRRELK
jgi:ABC-type transport system involved in multi-copper enzyme maturation permease subunit